MEAFGFLAASVAATYLIKHKKNAQEKEARTKRDLLEANTKATLAATDFTQIEKFSVPHLRDFFPIDSLQVFDSPLLKREYPKNLNFIKHGEVVVTTHRVAPEDPHVNDSHLLPLESSKARAFAAAGPVEKIYWDPKDVRAAIVTCGGLCPGLNTVVREIVMCLNYVYGVPKENVFGIQSGYRGFYSLPWINLTPERVSEIHTVGGTVLGSSRGGFDLDKILDALEANRISHLYVIGGDGTHRGALALLEGAIRRGSRMCVVGVPKTIDNDIPLVDRTFGFDTAVEHAIQPITCAHTEARAAVNGIGLVKLMGRAAGFIAAHASLANRDVNVCLIPEAPWRLSKLLQYLEKRLEERDHCLIVVAEGAESIEQKEAKKNQSESQVRRDASGNVLFDDIGLYLKDAINNHFKKVGKPCNLKYIDPSYIIRSQAPNASDSNLCTALAFTAVHGAMAGRTGFTVGTIDNQFVWLPINKISVLPPRQIDPLGHLYTRLCTSIGQPSLD